MDLSTLKTSISKMDHHDGLSTIMKMRNSRHIMKVLPKKKRGTPKSGKVTKKQSNADLVANLTREQKLELLKDFLEQ